MQLRLQRGFGILDPTKVTRTALQNAASIAGLMIAIEAMVAEAPTRDAPAGDAAPGTPLAYTGPSPLLRTSPHVRLRPLRHRRRDRRAGA